MARLLPLVALAISCDTPGSELRILAVTPNEGPDDLEQPIEIEVANLEFGVRVDYRHPDRSSVVGSLRAFVGDLELPSARLVARGRVAAIVPSGLAPGSYDVVIADGRARTAVLRGGYRVTTEVPVLPCTDGDRIACPYGGREEDEGVGICRAGARVCQGGVFGACQGEVLPAVEICNGIDESCDRIADDGCPIGTIEYPSLVETGFVGEMAPDEWGADGCAAGEVIVGFYGRAGRFLDKIGEYCARPSIVENTRSSPHTYSVMLGAPTATVARGGEGGSDFGTVCPIGQMVVGISGRADSNLITRFTFSCAAFELDATFGLREVPGTRAPIGLEVGELDGLPFDLPCPSDTVAARLPGAIATCCAPAVYIGTIGLACAEMAATTR